ncbi:hypothetical protein PIB30_061242 [Stylosanthes scabra]|uniref:Uncharacterized protein n=1 Tax=Stylosanthes scabra TaxID=79078 RepID=A0ABU6VIZ4_9FABA|nr:hypothetical protein [Stylosanthes scabra]
MLREEPRSLLPDEPKVQPPRASAGTGWGCTCKALRCLSQTSSACGYEMQGVMGRFISRVSSRGVSEVDTVPCQLHRSASELQGCPTSRNSSYTGREVVLRGLGLQSWSYWADGRTESDDREVVGGGNEQMEEQNDREQSERSERLTAATKGSDTASRLNDVDEQKLDL